MDFSRLLQAMRAGAVDPWQAALYHGGGKGKAPPAPDYRGAAQEQAAASKDAATEATWANRPTVNTPWGQESWQAGSAIDPATGKPVTSWTQNLTLSPDQQAALDAQMGIERGRSEAAQTLLGQATGAFQTPFDWEGLPEAPGSVGDAQQAAFQKYSAALEPGRARARSALDTKLANMGLPMTSEAYTRASGDLGEQFAQQDKGLLAQSMAEGRSDIATQQALRQAAIGEQAQRRGMPLNELNALLTGQQVSQPNMPDFKAAGTAQPIQSLDAAKAAGQYGLDAAQMRAQAGAGTGQLIGSIGTAAAIFF